MIPRKMRIVCNDADSPRTTLRRDGNDAPAAAATTDDREMLMPAEHKNRFLSSEVPPRPCDQVRFHVIPVPYEATVSYAGGTARGPEAILEASDQLELFDGTSFPGEGGIFTQSPVDCSGSPEEVTTICPSSKIKKMR